jgi:hypothetical protein
LLIPDVGNRKQADWTLDNALRCFGAPPELVGLPDETPTIDIHCQRVGTQLDTSWRGGGSERKACVRRPAPLSR